MTQLNNTPIQSGSRGEHLHQRCQGFFASIAGSPIWPAFMALVVSAFVAFGFFNPQSSWDVLGYTGSALTLAGVEDVHGETYRIAQKGLGDAYQSVITDNPNERASTYRSTMVKNPDAFSQQLPYYLIRPAYVGTLAIAYHWGIDPLTMMGIIAAASGLIVGALVYWRLARVFSPLMSFCLATALLLCFRLPAFSGFLSPDPLIAMLFIAFVFWFERGMSVVAVLLFTVVLVFCRSNAVVFTTPLLAVGLLAYYLDAPVTKLKPVFAAGIFLVSVALMKGIEHWAGNYGWWTVFYFTFVESTNFPAHLNAPFNVQQYLGAVVKGGRWLFSDRYATTFYVFMGILVLRTGTGQWRPETTAATLFFLMLSVIFAGYFVLFPAVFLRFYFAVFVLAGVFALVSLAPSAASRE